MGGNVLGKIVQRFQNVFYNRFYTIYRMPQVPTVVICMDGGLCSQMLEYSIGELFRESGFVVKYDFSWFRNCGKDLLGKNVRCFELDKLFPNVKIEKASKLCCERFKRECRLPETNIEKCVLCKNNYYIVNDCSLVIPYEKIDKIKRKLFSKPVAPTDKENLLVANEISSNLASCAVHVRRGDLANQEIAQKSGYGKCVTDDFYKNSILIMKKLIPDVKFYFFSDDLDYVRNNLLTIIDGIDYSIIDVNKDSALLGGGYKDFYLILLCKNQICSLGSFGAEAAKLNKNEDKIVIATKDIGGDIKNLIVLDSDGNVKASTIQLGQEI